MALLLGYIMHGYLVLQALWSHHEHEPCLAPFPMVTRTASGIPGDALNAGLVGSKGDVLRAMHGAGLFSADPITFRTGVEIIGSVVLDRTYRDAPVSPLYYNGEKTAYVREVRRTKRRAAEPCSFLEGPRTWHGGLSGLAGLRNFRSWGRSGHDIGQITHHLASNIDAERNLLMEELRDAGMVQTFFQISGTGQCSVEKAKAIRITGMAKLMLPPLLSMA